MNTGTHWNMGQRPEQGILVWAWAAELSTCSFAEFRTRSCPPQTYPAESKAPEVTVIESLWQVEMLSLGLAKVW